MRRNDIVRYKEDGWFYGRVVRVIDSDTVLWICAGRHINVSPMKDLVIENDYKGYSWRTFLKDGTETRRFLPMSSIRRLKQRASYYHRRNAWRTPLDYELMTRKTFRTSDAGS